MSAFNTCGTFETMPLFCELMHLTHANQSTVALGIKKSSEGEPWLLLAEGVLIPGFSASPSRCP